MLGGIRQYPPAYDPGGYLAGCRRILTKAYIGNDLPTRWCSGILIVVLMVKPAGIMGKYRKEKV